MFFGKKKQEGPSVPPPPSADDAEKKDYVLRELSKLYTKVFRPIEEATKFDVFYSSLLNEAEFRTPPMVLLVGPYSVGKTTFIEYFVQCRTSRALQFGVSRGDACIRGASCPSLGLSEVSAQVSPRPQVPGPAHRSRADDGPVHGRHVRRGRPDDSRERVDRGTELTLPSPTKGRQRVFE